EPLGRIADVEVVLRLRRRSARLPQEAGGGERALRVGDGLGGGIDERDVVPEMRGDGAAQQRVVRAAEDDDVRAEGADRLEVLPGDEMRRGMIRPALLDERDEQR